jgi:hypothetical protein
MNRNSKAGRPISALVKSVALSGLLIVSAWGQTDKYQLPAEQRTGSIKMIYLLCHSHLDIGFTKPSDQVARDYKDDIDTAIKLTRENPDYRWTIETAWMLEEWLRRTDDARLVDELGQLIRSGRMGFGAMFASMNSGLMSAEEVNRMVYAGEALRRRLGIEGTVAYHNDVPGSTWSYPRVLAGSGVKYLITGLNTGGSTYQPDVYNGNNLGPASRPFYWVGPDGSRVLQWFTRLANYSEGLHWRLGRFPIKEAERMVPRRLAWLEQNGYPYDRYLLMAAAGDNRDPYGAYLTLLQIREWNQAHPELLLRMATAEEFFRDLTAKYGDRFPEHSGDATGSWEQKKLFIPDSAAKMREVSNILPAAEMVATLASILKGATFPRFDFREAWRRLLVFHEHSNGEADWGTQIESRTGLDWNVVDYYANAMAGFSSANQQFDKALRQLAGHRAHVPYLLQEFDVDGPFTVMVYNGLSWTRNGPVVVERLPKDLGGSPLEVVDLASGEKLPCQDEPGTPRRLLFFARNVPATGYRLYSIQKSKEPVKPSSDTFPIRVAWNAEGWITSVLDEKSGHEMLDPRPGQPFGSLFSLLSGRVRVYQIAEDGKGSVQSEEAPVARRIEIRRPGSLLSTVVTLYREAPYADLRFDLDMRTVPPGINGHALALPFPQGKETFLNGAGFVYRVPDDRLPGGGAVDRLAVHFTHFKQASSWGITLANRDAFFWGPDPIIRLTRIPPEVAAGGRNLLRSEPTVSTTQSFRFRVGVQGPEPYEWERFGSELNLPLRVMPVSSTTQPSKRAFFEVSDPGVQLLAFKPAEDRQGWYVLRLQEIGGHVAQNVKLTAPFPVAQALLANTVERPLGSVIDLSAISMKPWETQTILLKPQ